MPPRKSKTDGSKHGRSLFEFMSPSPPKSIPNEQSTSLESAPVESRGTKFPRSGGLMSKVQLPSQNNSQSNVIITRELLLKTLNEVFKYEEFRPLQQEIIEALAIHDRDCVCILPTGAGKSMLYQLPAIAQGTGIAIVVSPLIALMKDQVDSLQKRGVAAEALHSELPLSQRNEILRKVSYPAGPKLRLLFVTPEYLTSEKSSSLVKGLASNGFLKFFAIDESHCISEWGNSFRSSFLKLGMLKRHYPNIPIIALTATATPKVREDIIRILQLENPKVFVSSFNRPEISLTVRYKDALIDEGVTVEESILSYIKLHKDQCGIVYCRKKEDCDNLAQIFQNHDISCESFHSGLGKEKKMEVQEGFQSGKYKVIVCTIAFGMGIDKSNVRYVIHYELSKSLESFSQESGRAARDGKPAESIVYYSHADKERIQFLIEQEHAKSKEEVKKEMHKKFNEMVNYCLSTKVCRRKILLQYFGERHSKDICQKKCDVCAWSDDVNAEFQRAYQNGSSSRFNARNVRSLLPPVDMNNEFTNPTLRMRDEPKEKKPSQSVYQQKRSQSESEKSLVSQRVNIRQTDSIDDIFAKLEADEKRYNPSFSGPRSSRSSSTNSKSVRMNSGSAIGFVPSSLKRKPTDQLRPQQKRPNFSKQ